MVSIATLGEINNNEKETIDLLHRAGALWKRSFTSPKKCISEINQLRPDILFMDPTGFGAYGVDVIAAIRHACEYNLKIIYWSDSPDPATVFAALANGADGFFEKGLMTDSECLKPVLTSVMKGCQVFCKGMINGNLLQAGKQSFTINSSRLLFELKITPRELDVCRGLVDGETAISDGSRLGVSSETIKTHRANLYKKINVRNQKEAVRFILSL